MPQNTPRPAMVDRITNIIDEQERLGQVEAVERAAERAELAAISELVAILAAHAQSPGAEEMGFRESPGTLPGTPVSRIPWRKTPKALVHFYQGTPQADWIGWADDGQIYLRDPKSRGFDIDFNVPVERNVWLSLPQQWEGQFVELGPQIVADLRAGVARCDSYLQTREKKAQERVKVARRI